MGRGRNDAIEIDLCDAVVRLHLQFGSRGFHGCFTRTVGNVSNEVVAVPMS